MLPLKTWDTGKDSNFCVVNSLADSRRLHKEIMDFYHHVKPREFEDYMRSDLVDRLRTSVRRKWKDADIYPFGSFVAGLYLPTADMDLVFNSDDYMAGHRPRYDTKNFLYKFQAHIIHEGFAVEGSIEIIAKARVPLVKYVDSKTGLRVDVSFENYTGINANKTFKDWKAKYPAMPILVTLIKQFLTMRGLNEPVNGGIGGFTVMCLVISLLQLLPQVQSGNMIPEHHLGEILMEFLDLYGNEFDAVTTAIQFDPPGYVSKVCLPMLSFAAGN
jgi:non-canonical poly(A) RNA polymerase PAPD5/7